MTTDSEILATMSRTLGDLLGEDSIVLTAATRRSDVDGWDSFTYISFIAAIEMEFGVKFGVADVESFEDVGAIVRRLKALQGK
jgi:acyl carrier protein